MLCKILILVQIRIPDMNNNPDWFKDNQNQFQW